MFIESNVNNQKKTGSIEAIADYITKVHAICVGCGNIAQFSYRFSKKDQVILLGEKDTYEALCRTCYRNVNQQ